MRIRGRIWVLIVVAALSHPAPGAGQDVGEAGQASSPGQETQTTQQSQAAAPDSRSFLGAKEFAPGRVGQMRSYFLPSLMISEMADSNRSVGDVHQKFVTVDTVVGRLSFGKIGRHSNLSLDYLGGGQVYNHYSNLNTTMHQFGISESYQGRRWSFLLDDRAAYLPESTFGFGGFGWSGSLGPSLGGISGSNLGNLNPMLNTTGALLTSRGSRIINTSTAEVQYAASARSSISVTGSYSLLHFRTPGLSNSKTATFFTSYSHTLSGRDYVGLAYGFTLYKLQSSAPTFQSHFFQFSYGHRITGRLAMQLGAGPLINKFQSPVAGPATVVSWTASGSLDYRTRRNSLGLSFMRYTTAGAGLLAGATTDYVRGTWGLQLTRKWRGSIGPGYARNKSLPQTSAINTTSTYDSIYAYGSLSRSLGRHATMFLSYQYESQRSQISPCLSGACENSLLRHVVTFGFDFHPRQLVFD
jgi:hypothetical protein